MAYLISSVIAYMWLVIRFARFATMPCFVLSRGALFLPRWGRRIRDRPSEVVRPLPEVRLRRDVGDAERRRVGHRAGFATIHACDVWHGSWHS